jgi:hypothetical protein
MAAAADGHRVAIDVFPQGGDARALGDEIVAEATFTRDETVVADPLFAHVFERRSNKEPFDTTRPVETATLQAVIAAGAHGTALGGTNADADVAFWRELTARALKIEIDTPHTYQESVDLFRIGKAEINANPDGIDFSGPLFESLALVGQFDRNVALDRNSSAFIQGEAAVLENALTATAHVWMVTAGNTRADQIAAGRDWLRVNLAATREGLGFQPLSQALQEYPEVAEPYRQTHERLAPSGGTVQMLVRLGYGPRVDQSPRWPLESRLI